MSQAGRIVIVDDDPELRSVVRLTLEGAGFEVREFASGPEALAALPGLSPSAIVCDLVMPEMDGWALFQHVKRSPGLASVPFVFLSADEAVAKALDSGADDFLNKPFSPAALVARVRAALRRARPASPGLRGEIGATGLLPVLQFLEANRLSATLTLELEVGVWRADFARGELTAVSGPQAPPPGRDPVKDLLRLHSGSWRLEPAAEAPAPAAAVDGAPLAAALGALAAAIEVHLDATATRALLRSTRPAELAVAFRTGKEAPVVCSGEVPGSAVAAAAAWSQALLRDAATLSPKAARINLRQATLAHAADLERLGYYAALEGRRG